MAPPMKAMDGVTYMFLVSRVPNQINPNQAMVFQQQQMMEQQQMKGALTNAVQEMMIRKANIKYNNDNIR